MRRLADTVPVRALGDGIARYVDLFRAQLLAPDMERARLAGDLAASRFALESVRTGRQFDSFISAPGREIAVRIHDPGGQWQRPGIAYFHGGGFSLGSVESFDIASAALARASGAVVVSIHYRRLPQTDYAGAQEDCDLGFAWLDAHAEALGVDPARIGVAGDSVGALLAFACGANARDARRTAPAFQLLFYGTFAMDAARTDYFDSRDPLLSGERIRAYINLFRRCGGLDLQPAPIDRADLKGLPPAHIVAAELDPLRSEAVAFAERLGAAGVPTSLQIAPGMIHGFLRAVGVSSDARAELSRAADALRMMIER